MTGQLALTDSALLRADLLELRDLGLEPAF